MESGGWTTGEFLSPENPIQSPWSRLSFLVYGESSTSYHRLAWKRSPIRDYLVLFLFSGDFRAMRNKEETLGCMMNAKYGYEKIPGHLLVPSRRALCPQGLACRSVWIPRLALSAMLCLVLIQPIRKKPPAEATLSRVLQIMRLTRNWLHLVLITAW